MQTESGPDLNSSLGCGPWQLNLSWYPAVLFLDIIVTGLGLCSVIDFYFRSSGVFLFLSG